MKKKFAFILAMLMAANPVMAASTNSLTKVVSIIEGTTISYDTTKVDNKTYYKHTVPDSDLRIQLQDVILDDQIFYINAVDSIFEKPAYASWALGEDVYTIGNNIYDAKDNQIDDFLIDTDTYSIKWISETQLEVTLKAGDTLYRVPLIAKATTGIPTLQIDETGTILTGGNIRLANRPLLKYGLRANVSSRTVLSTEGYGPLGTINLKENLVSALSGKTIKLELEPDSGLEFSKNQTNTGDDLIVKGIKGYARSIKEGAFNFIVDEIDSQIAYIQFPELTVGSGTSEIEISNIKVNAQGQEDVQLGNVMVEVSAVKEVQSYELLPDLKPIKLKIAEVQEDKVTISNQPTIEVIAGLTNDTVNVKIEDLTGEILSGKRNIYLLAEGARFLNGQEEIEIEVNEDEKEVKEINIDVNLAPTLNQNGDIKVIAQSRDFDEDIVTIVGTAVPSVKIETEQILLDRDTKPEPAGKIIINETMDTILENGKTIAIKVEDLEIKNLDIEAKGIGIKHRIKDGILLIDITKQSKEKGQIIIENIKFNTSRPVGIGEYALIVGGNALSNFNKETYFDDCFELEAFVQVLQYKPTEEIKFELQPEKKIIPQIKIDVTKDEEKQVNIDVTKDEKKQVKIDVTKKEEPKVVTTIKKIEPKIMTTITRKEEPKVVTTIAQKEEPKVVTTVTRKEEPKSNTTVARKEEPKVNKTVTEKEEPKVNIASLKVPKVSATVNTATGMATLNGKIMRLDGTPFITEANVSMMGVRDITNFLGIEDISFNNGVITIHNEDDVIQLKNGSNILTKNGQQTVMDEEVLIINGRTYAPIKFIANAVDFEADINGQITTFTK